MINESRINQLLYLKDKVWVASSKGLHTISQNNSIFSFNHFGLGKKPISALNAQENYLWVGTYNGEMYKINLENNEEVFYRQLIKYENTNEKNPSFSIPQKIEILNDNKIVVLNDSRKLRVIDIKENTNLEVEGYQRINDFVVINQSGKENPQILIAHDYGLDLYDYFSQDRKEIKINFTGYKILKTPGGKVYVYGNDESLKPLLIFFEDESFVEEYKESSLSTFSQSPIHSLVEFQKQIWLFNSTVFLNYTQGFTIENSYEINKILSATVRSGESVLLGTNGYGIYELKNIQEDFFQDEYELTNEERTRIFQGKNIELNNTVVLSGILFKESSPILLNESKETIFDLVTFLLENDDLYLKITGHTARTVSKKWSLNLSKVRATVVKNELMKMGISKKRIFIEGKGDLMLANVEDPHAKENRRVEVVFSKNKSIFK